MAEEINLPEQPAVPTATPAASQPKTSWTIPLLLILSIFSLSISGYLFWQNQQLQRRLTAISTPAPSPFASPQPTAEWKIFSDSQNGIEFKYPANWDAEKMDGWTFNVFLNDHSFELPTLPTEFMTPIMMSFNEIQNTTTNEKSFSEPTIEEALVRFKTYFFGDEIIDIKNLMIGGRKAIQVSGVYGPGMLQGDYYKTTLIQMDDKVLNVSLNNRKDFEPIYDQILSTFKFTE